MRRWRFLLFAGLVVLSGIVALPAEAKFTVCNQSEHAVMVAIGHTRSKTWTSEGWWKVRPKSCSDILAGRLRARYYYLLGIHMGANGNWNGNRAFCVANNNFTINGRKDCAKRGYKTASFFEIDTQDLTDFTQYLSD